MEKDGRSGGPFFGRRRDGPRPSGEPQDPGGARAFEARTRPAEEEKRPAQKASGRPVIRLL